MTVPGGNLLRLALTRIQPQAVEYRAFTGQTTTADMRQVSAYAQPVTLYGSFQPVSRGAMAVQGLDMTLDYALFYASQRFLQPGRDTSGDVLDYDGRRWQSVDKDNEWFAQDGWDALLLVSTGPLPEVVYLLSPVTGDRLLSPVTGANLTRVS